ncbi:extracellular serine-rich protein [Niveomyces insectorum RCEF 264]|uniref:Extracellular serine-rich protein n=1 Tax=Niveomyces insectorum RCEF 264 TaxID=1081102 RepID=A0A167WB57_9HYPO|nr:extracellular serine-rich protein [Niveomyces insectorum RCEF 264]
MLSAAVLLGLAASAAAKNIQIDVGENGFTFSPDSVTAAVGDVLDFHFHPTMHSVVMGDFDNACQPAKTGGFYSGFISGDNSDVFQVTINSTDPLFFYCSQVGHCAGGMSGVVNPSSDQTLDAYQSKAKSVSNAGSPPAPFGGVFVAANGGSSSSAAPPAASASGSGSPTASSTTASPASACTPGQTQGSTGGSNSGSVGGYRRRAADPCATTSPSATPTTNANPNGASQRVASLVAVVGLAGVISMLMA